MVAFKPITFAAMISFVAVGCVQQQPLGGQTPRQWAENVVAQENARRAAANAPNIPAQEAELKAVSAGKIPKDYKKIVDKKFVDILIDPDSRKVEFTKKPYGGLVCGTVNAKNKLGGFTGKSPFFVVFDANGKLQELSEFGDSDLKDVRSLGSPGDLLHVKSRLLKDCGAL